MNYFPRDLNIVVANYLNTDEESLKLLNMLNINEKYYTSKNYHRIDGINTTKYKIDKVIICSNEDGYKIYKLKKIIKRIILYDCNLNLTNLPEQLTHLLFKNYAINQPIDILPKGLKYLRFDCKYNESMDNLPKVLTHLICSDYFNQKVDNLPQSLTYLTFSDSFNQTVNNLPQSITHLTFGHCFNQKVDNLPNTITHLTFGGYFNQKVDNLPRNMKMRGCFTSSYLV